MELAPAMNPQKPLKYKSGFSNGEGMEDKRLVFEKGKQRALFQYLFENYKWSHRKVAELIGVTRHTVTDYFNEKNNIRLSTFQKLTSIDKNIIGFEKYIEKQMQINWGAKKGGKERAKLIENKGEFYSRLRAFKFQKAYKIAVKAKIAIEDHPLISNLIAENVDLHCVLGACLLTDGSLQVRGNSHKLSYSTIDNTLEKIIISLFNKLSITNPKVYFTKKGNIICVNDSVLGPKMLALSPSYKTSPSWSYQTKEQYLQESQPTNKFLFDADEKTKIWALRFAFTADGSISVPRKSYPSLDLACYHPTLAAEWVEFIQSMGFKCKLMKSKNSWCGISGVRMQTHKAFKKFYDLGGFIDGVKISKKSKRFCGMPKNELLEKVVNNWDGKGRNRTCDPSITDNPSKLLSVENSNH